MNAKSWLESFLERLLGTEFAGPEDARIWQCRPLVVTDENREIVFAGNAIAEFRPAREGEGVALAPGKEHVIPPIGVNKMTITHSGDRGRTPNGLMLRGTGPTGERYTWRINGAAISFLKKQVHERWLGVEGDDVAFELRHGSLGALE